MNNQKLILIGKCIAAMFFSFILLQVLTHTILTAYNPKLNSELIDILVNPKLKPSDKIEGVRYYLATNLFGAGKISDEKIKQTIEEFNKSIQDKPLIPVGSGIYAKESEKGKAYQISFDDMKVTEYTYNLNGKIIKIRIPEGSQPPSEEKVKLLYNVK